MNKSILNVLNDLTNDHTSGADLAAGLAKIGGKDEKRGLLKLAKACVKEGEQNGYSRGRKSGMKNGVALGGLGTAVLGVIILTGYEKYKGYKADKAQKEESKQIMEGLQAGVKENQLKDEAKDENSEAEYKNNEII